MTYTRREEKIQATHKVRQLGSVWLWTLARRIEVRDILQFADDLRAANAPEGAPVEFGDNPVEMSVEWTTEESA